MLKKIALVLSLLFIIIPKNLCCVAEDYDYAQFVAKGNSCNITSFGFSNGGGRYTLKDNENCFRLTNSGVFNKLFLDVSDSYFYSKSGQAATVEIKYFDTGNNGFCLNYSYYNNDTGLYEDRSCEPVYFTDTGGWKTYTYTLESPSFRNSVNEKSGNDIYISVIGENATDQAFIRSVTVRKTDTDVPVTFDVESSIRGNIFDTNQTFSVILHNEAQYSSNAILTYKVYDENKNLVFENMLDSVIIDPMIDYRAIINTNISHYGVYNIVITVSSLLDDNTTRAEYSERIPFSVVNKTTSGDRNTDIGIHSHLINHGYIYENIDILKDAGFGAVREGLAWWRVEEKKGDKKIPEVYKGVQAYISQCGMENLMILSSGSSLYGMENQRPPYSDEEMEEFAKYCSFVAEQYKGIVKYYEIWNEYNISEFNKPLYGADVYARMLKYAYEAIKSVDSDAKIVGFSLAGRPYSDPKYGFTYTDFLDDALNYGAGDYFDILSVHFYQHDDEGVYTEEFFRKRSADLKAVLEKHNIDKPIWWTETGWTNVVNNEIKNPVSEREQAIFATKLYLFSKADNLWDKMFWYVNQNTGSNPSEYEDNFGILDSSTGVKVPGRAKNAYVAFAAMNKIMANTEYIGRIDKENSDIYRYEKSDGTDVAALWTDTDDEKQIWLNLGAGNIKVLDMYSNEIKALSSSVGYYNITYGNEPIYIIGDFSKFEEVEMENISLKLLCGNEEFKGISQLLQNNAVESELYIANEDISSDSINLIMAVYSDTAMMYVDIANFDGNVGVKKATFNFSDIGINKIKSISFFVWKNDMSPMMTKIEIN